MGLFQKSVLKKYLAAQDNSVIEKSYKKYKKFFHNKEIQENIKSIKEEQFQAKFLIQLFVDILGYTLNPDPNYNLTTEFKNEKGAKKADGALLKDGKALAVVELKGTKTKDLERIRQQAFDYKAHQSACVYVITSNFEKVRFYINNAIDYEDFNLFTLRKEEFALLYLCLHKDNLLNNVPLQIKNDSLVSEEKITKKLYVDYSLFKRELFRDLVKRNMKNEVFRAELEKEDKDRAVKNIKLTIFRKSQKLIDRFLFIFFAEDRGLLPPNSTLKILEQWDTLKDLDTDIPLYNRYKKYFSYLDIGRKRTATGAEIFAYNGGLFKPDPILDSMVISDELLYKYTKKISNYDFESQVDVNILGHIFENSLNEIESVNAEIEGIEFDKQKTKRKKDGVFYTPKYITKYIVDNTIGKLCLDKKEELGFIEDEYLKPAKGRHKATLDGLRDLLKTYREWLLSLTILDPACGSGAFLNQAIDFLIKEHQYIDELQASLFGQSIVFQDIENTILENNIYGVDLNEESVEIAKLSLWLRTAQPRRKLNSLNNNIKCGNSLIASKTIAGNKAFNWEEEFPKVFAKGGFDVVIGNPPYVRAELLGAYIDYLSKEYNVFHSASDLFAYFYELGSSLINENGVMGYISNTFDKTKAGFVLRDFLCTQTRLRQYVDFTEVQIFEGATTYPVIIILDKKDSKENQFEYIKIPKSSQALVISVESHKKIEVAQNYLTPESWSFLSVEKAILLRKMLKKASIRDIYGKCYYGIKTALNEAFITQTNISVNSLELNHFKPIYEGKEMKKWTTPPPTQNLILFKSKWTKDKYGKEGSEEDYFQEMKQDYPDLISHLEPFEQKGKKRYDKGDYWWELRNCAYYDLFEQPKIIFPNLQNSNKFCLDEKGVYINAPAVFLPVASKALLCILNSKIVWEFLKSICVVRSGGYIEVKPQYFEQIPIPALENLDVSEIESLADKIIERISKLQSIENKFKKYFQSQFNLEKLSKKLLSWHILDFGDFIKELNKAIKKAGGEKLSKMDEMDWMEVFETKKAEAQALKAEIEQVDKEIDQMVYELYGLTAEEIEIIENS